MSSTTYYSFLLRLWQVKTDGGQEWRALLENVETGEKRGFASLEALLAYLRQVNVKLDGISGEAGQSEVQG